MHKYTLHIANATTSMMLLTVLVLSGCAQMRFTTYPDSIVWIDADDVRSAMHTMAASLATIEQLVSSETEAGENQEEVLEELYTLETTAQSLSAGKASTNDNGARYAATNHLLIDDHLDEFSDSILLAQLHVQATPPNYYRAGTLVGSCNACHRFR